MNPGGHDGAGNGRRRVVIQFVKPEIDCGRNPVKRTTGETVLVEADIFADGHDSVSAALLFRRQDASTWSESPMEFLVNDRWRGEFPVTEIGRYVYTLQAWVDHFKSWRRDMLKRIQADEDSNVEYEIGAGFVEAAAGAAAPLHAQMLAEAVRTLRGVENQTARRRLVLDEELSQVMARYPDRRLATTYRRHLEVIVDAPRARFSTWYELFPRSCSPEPGRHGTFRDCEARLPYVADMGFDVLYLPPIHPIGRTHRKGRNNSPIARPDDVGSPWGIGSAEGGHKSIHPELGTLDDFRRLVARAAEYGIQIALDIAFQCSRDHPYVRDHPEWFRRRPDGTVQYAENPPKKYQDIYPFEFETEHWKELWEELKSIVVFWAEQGVRIFRVDNPHTKPFPFWEWLISGVREQYPEAIFLSEAFTRPKVMAELAKAGFTQSYTYFTWRNRKSELTEYFLELFHTEMRQYFRPNLWPNTPDILPEYLQTGGRAGFMARLVLAATLGASYGIYGPAFELCENVPREPGAEEYLNSEKYEIRSWDLDRPDSLRDFIARVNRIRRENPALQSDWNLRFHDVDNDQIICYSKQSDDLANLVLVAVNLDPHHKQSGWVDVPARALDIAAEGSYQVHDLLSDARFLWQGARNYIELDPRVSPAQIFRVRRRVRTEREFEYYM
jgi:starch synthase (maltosyl-transferring)